MTPPNRSDDDLGPDIPHLRQCPRVNVGLACMELLAFDLPHHIRQELEAWRETRTPHDAVRLTNALWYWQKATPNPVVLRIVGDIDKLAEDTAGCKIPNRHLREEKS
jgi:hypothetical protein